MLKLQNTYKTYKNGDELLHALHDVTLEFHQGDFAFLLGESGSGKSTLLNVLSGLDVPSKGSVFIEGTDTRTFSKKDYATFRNNHVGFIFQEYNLIDHLSVLDNVTLPLLFQGVDKKEAKERARNELEKIGLKKHVAKKPQQLSGGQQQRVAIARALVTNPKIILADEPTGSLDEAMGEKTIAYLKKHAQDKVVIVVTHNEELAEKFANRTIRIQDGKILDDSKEETNETASVDEKTLNINPPKVPLGILFKFAKNNVFSRIFRTFLTSAIVAIGFVAILLLTFIVLGIRGSLSDAVASLIPPDEYQLHPIEDTFIDSDTFNRVRDHEHVEDLRYNIRLNIPSRYRTLAENTHELTYLAVPFDPFAFERDGTLHGRLPENENEVVISLRTALSLREMDMVDEESYGYVFDLVEGYDIRADHLNSDFSESKRFTIVGMSEETQPQNVYLSYDALLKLAEQRLDEKEYKTSAIAYLSTSDDGDIDALRRDLRDDEGLVLRNVFGEITTQIDDVMFTALQWFVGISLISLVVAGILIGLVIYTSVLERVREIGILTALGARGSNIRGIFLIESGIGGLLSGTIAAVAAVFIALGLNRLFNNFIEAPLNLLTGGNLDITLLDVSIPAIALVLVAGVLYAMLSGWIPSKHATKLNAVSALRKE